MNLLNNKLTDEAFARRIQVMTRGNIKWKVSQLLIKLNPPSKLWLIDQYLVSRMGEKANVSMLIILKSFQK